MCSNVENEIQKKWKQITDLFQKHYDLKQKRLKLKLGKDNIAKLYIEDKTKRLPSPQIVVRFADGTELRSPEISGADLLVRFIEKVGVIKVQQLGIIDRKRCPLISDSVVGIEEMEPKEIDGKYVITKTGNKEKVEQIREIIDKLNLSCIIE